MIARLVLPAVIGILFGAGLAVGGMTDPARVRGFLDVFGQWDPTLAFVMGGAMAVMVVAWRLVPRMAHPLFAEGFALPERSDITARLVGGSILFGIGWGLAGLCPGPGFAALAIAPLKAGLFVIGLVAGMGIYRVIPGEE